MKKYIPIILSALLMGVAHQPIGYGWIAWFSLIPFIQFLDSKNTSLKSILSMGVIWGFTYHITIIFWMFFNLGMPNKWMSALSLILSVLILTANTILIVSLYSIISKNKFSKIYFSIPVIWVSVEYLRTFSFLGFPWVSLANSQTDYILLAQNVEYTGIYGISFWIVLINVMIYDYYKSRRGLFDYTLLSNFFIVLIIPFLSGYFLYHKDSSINDKSLNAIIVQPNIPIDQKGFNVNESHMISIIEDSINDNTDLVLLPETAISYYSLKHPVFRKFIHNKLSKSKTSLLSGIVYRNNSNIFNSVIHIHSGNIDSSSDKDIYSKIQLVPLAEYNPFKFISGINSSEVTFGNFTQGDVYKVFNINGHKVASMVCYESTFPQLNRKFVNNGAEILAYFVNDGWYKDPYEPEQHASQSIFRAIEFRRPVIRCANTGISQIVDKKGNITQQLELNTNRVISANIIPSTEMTFYAKYGDVFSIINILLVFILLAMTFRRKA